MKQQGQRLQHLQLHLWQQCKELPKLQSPRLWASRRPWHITGHRHSYGQRSHLQVLLADDVGLPCLRRR